MSESPQPTFDALAQARIDAHPELLPPEEQRYDAWAGTLGQVDPHAARDLITYLESRPASAAEASFDTNRAAHEQTTLEENIYENMGMVELARKLGQAELDGDKTSWENLLDVLLTKIDNHVALANESASNREDAMFDNDGKPVDMHRIWVDKLMKVKNDFKAERIKKTEGGNHNKQDDKFRLGESVYVRRTNGDVEDNWSILGKYEDGSGKRWVRVKADELRDGGERTGRSMIKDVLQDELEELQLMQHEQKTESQPRQPGSQEEILAADEKVRVAYNAVLDLWRDNKYLDRRVTQTEIDNAWHDAMESLHDYADAVGWDASTFNERSLEMRDKFDHYVDQIHISSEDDEAQEGKAVQSEQPEPYNLGQDESRSEKTGKDRVKIAFKRAKAKLSGAAIGAGFTTAIAGLKEYFNPEDEKVGKRRRAVGIAVGAVAAAGVAYLAYKGLSGGNKNHEPQDRSVIPGLSGEGTGSKKLIELQITDERLPWTHMTDTIGSNGTPRILELVDKGQAHGWEFLGNGQGGGLGAILSVKAPDGRVLTGNGNINAALDYIANNYN